MNARHRVARQRTRSLRAQLKANQVDLQSRGDNRRENVGKMSGKCREHVGNMLGYCLHNEDSYHCLTNSSRCFCLHSPGTSNIDIDLYSIPGTADLYARKFDQICMKIIDNKYAKGVRRAHKIIF